MSTIDKFSQLDKQTQDDLITWYNVVPAQIDDEDKQLLLELFNNEGFKAWDCTNCGERCFLATPADWSNFQGTGNVDYTSYPPESDEALDWCDSCRCHEQ